MADRHIHFVGSIGLEDAETVFRALGEAVGTRAPRDPARAQENHQSGSGGLQRLHQWP